MLLSPVVRSSGGLLVPPKGFVLASGARWGPRVVHAFRSVPATADEGWYRSACGEDRALVSAAQPSVWNDGIWPLVCSFCSSALRRELERVAS